MGTVESTRTTQAIVSAQQDSKLLPTALGSLGFLVLVLVWFWRFGPMVGLDFAGFYIPAQIGIHDLYSRSAFSIYGRENLSWLASEGYPAYVRPAVFALALKPLALLSFWSAFMVWAGIALAAYFANVYLLIRRLDGSPYMLALFGGFFPAISGIAVGHDITLYTLVVTLSLFLLSQRRDVPAGLLLGLCAYKFGLILLVPFVLIAHRRWTALITMSAVVAAEAAASALLIPPRKYIELLRYVSQPDNPDSRLHFGGMRGLFSQVAHHESWYLPLAVLGIGACLYFIWHLPMREGFCVALIGILLFGYQTAWYDCTLLIVPLAILLKEGGRAVRLFVGALLLLPPLWYLGSDRLAQVVIESAMLLVFCRRSTLLLDSTDSANA